MIALCAVGSSEQIRTKCWSRRCYIRLESRCHVSRNEGIRNGRKVQGPGNGTAGTERATLKRCSKYDEAGERSLGGSSARESPVVRSVAWSQDDMCVHCCVSSLALTSIGSLVRGRANKDLFRAGGLIARAQMMSDCWQYCNVACVQLDMYVSSGWCQFCKYTGKQSAIAASGCSNGGEVSHTLDEPRSEHG